MKNLTKMLFVSVVMVVFLFGCEKDPHGEFYPILYLTGEGFVNDEKYTDDHRQGFNLETCEAIGWMAVGNAKANSTNEFPADITMVKREAGNIYRDEDNRGTDEKIQKRKDALWKELKGSGDFVNENVLRIAPCFSSHIEIETRSYVVDRLYFGGGVDEPWTEESLANKMNDSITYGDHPYYINYYYYEVFYYFYFFAIDPANYAEAKQMGAQTPTIEEMLVLYPKKLIKSFKTLDEFRAWSKTKADYSKGKFPAEYTKVHEQCTKNK